MHVPRRSTEQTYLHNECRKHGDIAWERISRSTRWVRGLSSAVTFALLLQLNFRGKSLPMSQPRILIAPAAYAP